MKVILTEQQFKDYIKYLLESSIIYEGSREKSKNVVDLQGRINDRVRALLDTNPDLQNKANLMGVNPSYNQDEYNRIRNKGYNGIDLNAKLKEKLQNAARILTKYTNPNSNSRGSFNFKQLEKDYPNDYVELLHIKEFLDTKGLSWLYDKYAAPEDKLTASGRHIFGANREEEDVQQRINDFDLTTIDQDKDWNEKGKLTPMEAEIKMKGNFLDAYMEKTYGLEAQLPQTVFSNGNKKLSSKTLIINFTAAMQCPAWNECLLRNACYARRGEKQHTNVRDANVQRNLMWEAGHQDPELMQMIFQLIRLYCINYEKAVKMIKKKTGENYTVDELSKKHFGELSPEVLKILKIHKEIENIRLNENGDFIGDWLISAVDQEAGDFKLVDIATSAYTCRNIKDENGNSVYNKVANIILNVSNQAINSNAVTRYFFALDPEIYNLFDETYGGPNNKLVLRDKLIKPIPQPLYDFDKETGEIVPTGDYYYKCPCERTGTNGKKINCYNCNICYQPNTVSEHPYYVLVQTHSNGAKKAKGIHLQNGNKPQFGFSKNFLVNAKFAGIEINTNQEQPTEYRRVSESRELLREAFGNSFKEGVITVARYCVNSIKQHLNNIAQQ